MGKTELNQWAVMNLTMEDRGQQPQEPDFGHAATQRNAPAAERFLSGSLSYFGVSSLCSNINLPGQRPKHACRYKRLL